MGTLIITSETVTETDLSNIPETVEIYSAEIAGKKLSDKWIVPENTDDATTRAEFSEHLSLQGYIFS